MDQPTGSPHPAKKPNPRAFWETERVWKPLGARRSAHFGIAPCRCLPWMAAFAGLPSTPLPSAKMIPKLQVAWITREEFLQSVRCEPIFPPSKLQGPGRQDPVNIIGGIFPSNDIPHRFPENSRRPSSLNVSTGNNDHNLGWSIRFFAPTSGRGRGG